MESKEELRKKIEGLKIKMIQSSEERGMNNHLTIHIGQELDKLINEYMKIDKKGKEKEMRIEDCYNREFSFLFLWRCFLN